MEKEQREGSRRGRRGKGIGQRERLSERGNRRGTSDSRRLRFGFFRARDRIRVKGDRIR